MTEEPPLQEVAAEGVQQQDRRPSRKTLLIGAGALVAAVAAVVVGLTFAGGGSKDLTVTFSLVDIGGGSTCAGGTGGYGDIGPGTAVVVKDNDSHIIGTADLGDGQHTAPDAFDGFVPGGCVWQTTIHDVPTGKKFYSIEVSHRGSQVYSADQLDKRKWMVQLSLGGS